jgi:thymidylate kinase
MRSSQLIIFEGPDGGGKTTAMDTAAKQISDQVITEHHGPYPEVTKGLALIYADSMAKATQGRQVTLLDRSWLSEVPYGKAFRDGLDRLGEIHRRHLERLAWRCGAVIMLCLPPWRVVRDNYLKRQNLEYLENEDQLRLVYNEYEELWKHTSLPIIRYDYTRHDLQKKLDLVFQMKVTHHRTEVHSAGNLNAPILLVGDTFGAMKPGDCEYQWPFGSLVDVGCSSWMTYKLIEGGILENELCWVNADELTSQQVDADLLHGKKVIALGTNADLKLVMMGVDHQTVAHPQFHKRFEHDKPYALIALIQDILKQEVLR